MKHTAYNSEEVVDWHSAFLEDNPEGTLGKVTILVMETMEMLVVTIVTVK